MPSDAPNAPIAPTVNPALTLDHRAIMRVVSGVALCVLLAALDLTVVIPALPSIARDLDGFDHLSWIVTVYLLTSTVSTPIYGKLSDIYGRRRLLRIAIACFLVASLACALAPSFGLLIVARAVQGIGGGGLLSLAQAAMSDVVAPRHRGRYQGYLTTVWGAASLAGPLLGGWIADQLSWRWLFAIDVPLGLTAILLCDRGLLVLPVPAPGGKARVDWPGAILLAAVIVACLLALSLGGTTFGWISPQLVGLAAMAMLALALLVRQERRAADPLLPPYLFANRAYVTAVAASSLTSLATFLCIFSLPLYFQMAHGGDAAQSGLLLLPFLLSMVTGNYAVAVLAPRVGKLRILLTSGLAIGAAGLLVMAVTPSTLPLAAAVGGMTLAGLGLGIAAVSAMLSAQNVLGPGDAGTGIAAMLVLRSIGSAFGAALAGAVLTWQMRAASVRAGLGDAIDLAALRRAGAALDGLPAAAQQLMAAGIASAIHMIFALGCVTALLSLAIARRAPDLELRSSVGKHAGAD